MSASEVTACCCSSRSMVRAMVGSKIVSSRGTSSLTSRTISARRSTTASVRPTTATESVLPLEGLPDIVRLGLVEVGHVRAQGLERARGLLAEVTLADHHDAATGPCLPLAPLHRRSVLWAPMTTASGVPCTYGELEGDEALETLRRTGRRRLVEDAVIRFRAADGFSHSRALAFQTTLTLLPR